MGVMNRGSMPSEEKRWLNYYSEEAKTLPELEDKVWNLADKQYDNMSNKMVISNFDCEVTGKAMQQRVAVTSKALAHMGVKKGDVVTFIGLNTTRLLTYVYAANNIGAVVHPLSAGYNADEIGKVLALTGSNKVIVLDQLYPNLRKTLDNKNIDVIFDSPTDSMNPLKLVLANFSPSAQKQLNSLKVDIPNRDNFHNLKQVINYAKYCKCDPKAAYEENALAFLFQSSASKTGQGKTIMHSNESLLATINMMNGGAQKRNPGNELMLVNIPLNHTTGLIGSFFFAQILGIPVVIQTMFDKNNLGPNLKKYNPSLTVGPPSHYEALLTSKEFEEAVLDRLQFYFSGGEPFTIGLQKALKDLFEAHGLPFFEVTNLYGLSELPMITMPNPNGKSVIGSVGIPGPRTQVKITDTVTGEEVDYNTRGIIRAKSKGTMLGYYNEPELTKASFDEEGYLITEDIGMLDENANLYAFGRESDKIETPEGEIVYLFDINSALSAHPAVQLCETTGTTCDGESKLFVDIVLREEYKGFEAEMIVEIDNYIRKNLPENHFPYAYRFRDKFVALPSGKRNRIIVREDRTLFNRMDGSTLCHVCVEDGRFVEYINESGIEVYEADKTIDKKMVLNNK